MDKSKILKIAIAIIIGIFAIIYYVFNQGKESEYDDLISNTAIVDNTVENNEKENKKSIIKVYVTGAVNNPGVIELEEGSRIQDAIEGVGGITNEANIKNINLAYEVSDGEKIYIPNLSEDSDENIEDSSNQKNQNEKVNINKATVSELTNVPGIGASTAEKIIAYRDKNGKFKTIEDIKNVSGIGQNKYENIKDHITVK